MYNQIIKNMKTIRFYQILIITVLFTTKINAQEPITISGTKFTYPLIEKWIAEYNKENPQVQISLVGKKADAKKADISIIAHQPLKNDIAENQQIVYVNKFALLPVAGKSNEYLKGIKKRGLNKKELEKLFFEESLLEEKQEKSKYPVNIYARESHACSAVAFANYFGYDATEIRGKKIAGDDVYLLSSIKKDTLGITYNILGNLYDKQTRKLKDDFTVLPLDITKEATIAINSNVDDAIKVLENERFETIPVERVGFIYDSNNHNKELIKFLKWTLTEGQKYNHEFGFLNLNKDLLLSQNERLAELYLTSK